VSSFRDTVNGIDDAINKHIKTNRTKTSIVTGWMVIASISDAENPDRDGYILQSSASLPHHTQVGLLSMALEDKKNLSMLATIKALMGDE
jgi:hypothetical protein